MAQAFNKKIFTHREFYTAIVMAVRSFKHLMAARHKNGYGTGNERGGDQRDSFRGYWQRLIDRYGTDRAWGILILKIVLNLFSPPK